MKCLKNRVHFINFTHMLDGILSRICGELLQSLTIGKSTIHVNIVNSVFFLTKTLDTFAMLTMLP